MPTNKESTPPENTEKGDESIEQRQTVALEGIASSLNIIGAQLTTIRKVLSKSSKA